MTHHQTHKTLVKTGQKESSDVTLKRQGEVDVNPIITPLNKALFEENHYVTGKEKWSERQDSNLSETLDSQSVTNPGTQRDTQTQVILGHDLSRVVTAWVKLPAPLKAAILAIINSAEGQP